MNMVIASSIAGICMGVLVLFIRMKAAKKPVSAKKIILPPMFMSTGALMFLFPQFQVTYLEMIEALLVGFVFSIFLIKTSKFEVKENQIYLKRSRAFVFILIGLLIIRICAKLILSAEIEVGQLGGMFWILAFGMIVPWRLAMYIHFRKIHQELRNEVNTEMI
ncbi:cytochrome c biogenesis protein CcdC [Bacillaceae bacterium Marseille-Q3522]|nr:cytochrome c biogenesis protein CcdC [Bacillaceae bacterium Marseille-Q3522]